eukprot:scaffold388_cov244-Pinguiococcus_pyrenoidosus.AAC.17
MRWSTDDDGGDFEDARDDLRQLGPFVLLSAAFPEPPPAEVQPTPAAAYETYERLRHRWTQHPGVVHGDGGVQQAPQLLNQVFDLSQRRRRGGPHHVRGLGVQLRQRRRTRQDQSHAMDLVLQDGQRTKQSVERCVAAARDAA